MRSYQDSSGGNDNLVMFRKDAIGMRIWQQAWGSSTPYSSFKDVAWTDGTNATGNWGINITGNAGTVTNGVYTTDDQTIGGLKTFTSNVTATGFFNSSDGRLKNIIERDGDTIKFTWKDGRDSKIHIGYIAQEVQEKYPDQVSEDTSGMLTVNYIEVLVAKIQELENRIKQLEK
jgi:hypothetical protein